MAFRNSLHGRAVEYDDNYLYINNRRIGMGPAFRANGDIYWVDSNVDAADGLTPESAVGTIDEAIALCTANNGDVIVVAEGHAENISASTSLVIDVAGIHIVGLGHGSSRPTLTWTATGGTVEVDAADTIIENILFVSSVSAVTVGVNVDAANTKFLACEWNYDATGDDFLIMADCTDVAGTEFLGCIFRAEEATAGANSAVHLDNSDDTKIIGCFSFGDFALAPIYSDTSGETGDGGSVSSGLLIKDNDFHNDDTTLGIVIDLNNADTGVISYNALAANGGGVAATLDPGSCRCVQNYATSAIDVTAAVVPQTADT